MAMLNSIPEELLVKIFIVQPTKTLLRLRAVCKFWDQVITSEFFIKSHFTHQKTSLNTNKLLLLGYGSSLFTSYVDSESYNNILESYEYDLHSICAKHSANQSLKTYGIYGICDGLLCLSHAKYDLNSGSPICLWNPFVRKVKKLPRIEIRDIDSNSYLCFGRHDDDYKVINVVPLREAYEVYIYSLSKNSWENKRFHMNRDDYPDKFDIWPYVKARFVNGAAYFVRGVGTRSRVIVCFDLSCKIIRQIKVPFELPYTVGYFFMEEYQESIALIESYWGVNVVVWALKVSDNYLWERKFTISMDLKCFVKPLGFVSKGKAVVLETGSRGSGYKYFQYNVEDKSQQPLTSPETYSEELNKHERSFWGINDVRLYDLTESLILLTEATTS